ncbi:DUF3299 domain-containing protein [Pseudorhodoferax sp. Leaf265]|jgi:hypothetical protein|uniref:DUF3299 domain-containing protein n=1 Tax=Pseudorhodoferax sp. Leaf265 TaxID=1736315 RepID=UPI0006F98A09|nr:DUF3299 domain-containing protein [Pseudorhodoferax sp. Leaf265]KQP21043.1 hypothetical protein ASF45_02310 [Pseudorhodoferax sp. Leaf265]
MFQDRDRMPTRRAALAACAAAALAPLAARAAQFREITWTELVPAGWDPAKDLQGLSSGAGGLQDTDPRAKELMDKLREIWDNAPTVAAMNGIDAKLPGYLVPLEEGKQGIREFLLVPYFGACIHTPPPPSNQILLGRAEKPFTGLRTMEAVWVYGRLEIERAPSSMGVAGYTMRVAKVEKYREK